MLSRGSLKTFNDAVRHSYSCCIHPSHTSIHHHQHSPINAMHSFSQRATARCPQSIHPSIHRSTHQYIPPVITPIPQSIHPYLPPSFPPTCTQCDCIVWLAAMTQWMSFVTLMYHDVSHHITPMHTQLAVS